MQSPNEADVLVSMPDFRFEYERKHDAAATTNEYLFNQLIPYIGNKRKLLGLVFNALSQTSVFPSSNSIFVDFFAGSGAVSRFAKRLGFTVYANDWEPYAEVINQCYIEHNKPPEFSAFGGYEAAIGELNSLPPREDWVTIHLCPSDDENYNVQKDRMFFMRKNGLKIDAIRETIRTWQQDRVITRSEASCLLAPLIYQCCYTSNTSGVFKGFHRGWGGATKTALYRICADLEVSPAVFFDNTRENRVFRQDAQRLAEELDGVEVDVAYLDPPYNQHPYGSNYHVLNSVALWDKPKITPQIEGRNKAAIRKDWRTERRSEFNYSDQAAIAYEKLINSINARYILTSYSTDGNIPLEKIVGANMERGEVSVVMKSYKRYRVSSQRFSKKPLNIEFILVTNTHSSNKLNLMEVCESILQAEAKFISNHSEARSEIQPSLFD